MQAQEIGQEKNSVALFSVLAAVLITLTKIVVGVATNSLGILAEAAHSGLDLVAAIITLWAVRVADKPADDDHPYGHSKIENFSALIETVILLATCGWIIKEAVSRLTSGAIHMEVTFWSYAVMVLSVAVDYWRSRALMRVAKKYNSQALEADALHFSTDIYSSIVVIIGLVCAQFNFMLADVLAALIVAVIVIFISVRLIKRTYDALIDTSPHGLAEKISGIVKAQPGILGCRALRVRQTGMYTFCDMVVGIDRRLPFETTHEIANSLERQIKSQIPHCDTTIHAEPETGSAESFLDKVRLAVINLGHFAHNIEISELAERRYLVDLHLESAGDASFEEAHSSASAINEALRRQFPEVEIVATHLEQEREEIKRCHEVTALRATMIKEIKDICERTLHVKGCKDIRVFEKSSRYKVLFTVVINRGLALDIVHRIVTDIENAVRLQIPNVERLVVQAEPSE